MSGLDPLVVIFGLLGLLGTVVGVLWRSHEKHLEDLSTAVNKHTEAIAKLAEKLAAFEVAIDASKERIKSVGDSSHRFNAANIDDHRAIREWITEKLLKIILRQEDE